MVDAPVRGSVPQATAGRLAMYVGADASDFQRVEPILAALGTPHHVGGPGAGAATKVVVNSPLVAAVAAFGEALALGEVLGLDRPVLLDVLPNRDRTHRQGQARQRHLRPLPAQLQTQPGPQGPPPGHRDRRPGRPAPGAGFGVARLARAGSPGRRR
jgi:3-hydroxyisobutyrate dehydrogenase-like beta-hydroxyacid dehydrogenase